MAEKKDLADVPRSRSIWPEKLSLEDFFNQVIKPVRFPFEYSFLNGGIRTQVLERDADIYCVVDNYKLDGNKWRASILCGKRKNSGFLEEPSAS